LRNLLRRALPVDLNDARGVGRLRRLRGSASVTELIAAKKGDEHSGGGQEQAPG
jgi:hypothetical protein